jgi:hypothetical protein
MPLSLPKEDDVDVDFDFGVVVSGSPEGFKCRYAIVRCSGFHHELHIVPFSPCSMFKSFEQVLLRTPSNSFAQGFKAIFLPTLSLLGVLRCVDLEFSISNAQTYRTRHLKHLPRTTPLADRQLLPRLVTPPA